MPFAATWMELEMVILREVSQTQKDEHHTVYMWRLKKGYKWACLQNRSKATDVENKLMLTEAVGRRDKLGDWEGRVHSV